MPDIEFALPVTGGSGWLRQTLSKLKAAISASAEADTVVSNSTAETTIASLATPDVVAVGDRLILRAGGEILNNSGGAVTYTFRLKIGGTTVLTSTAVSLASSASNRKWVSEFVIALESLVLQRVLATFNITASGAANLNIAGSTAFTGVGYGTAAEDLSTTKNVVLTVQMDTANAASTATLHVASLARQGHV